MIKKTLATLLAAPLLLTAALQPVAAQEEVTVETAPIDVRDLASLQAGARTFVNYCLSCHSAALMRYNQMLDIGLTADQIRDNLMFTAQKIGEPMAVAMTKSEAKEWFGAAPPDLSVIARSRGADWLYTYLRSFYRDPSRATGWNNAVFPNVGMPHVLWQLQGERIRREEPVMRDGKPVEEDGRPLMRVSYETVKPGTQTPEQYDRTVRDLVNFLVWMGEPHQLERKRIGIIVLFVLSVLALLTYMLKREFWKDVH